jgi:hypothetical protein
MNYAEKTGYMLGLLKVIRITLSSIVDRVKDYDKQDIERLIKMIEEVEDERD